MIFLENNNEIIVSGIRRFFIIDKDSWNRTKANNPDDSLFKRSLCKFLELEMLNIQTKVKFNIINYQEIFPYDSR